MNALDDGIRRRLNSMDLHDRHRTAPMMPMDLADLDLMILPIRQTSRFGRAMLVTRIWIVDDAGADDAGDR